MECDLEVIVSKAQELLHTDKLDWIGFYPEIEVFLIFKA